MPLEAFGMEHLDLTGACAPRIGTFLNHSQLNLLLSRGIKDENAERLFSLVTVRLRD